MEKINKSIILDELQSKINKTKTKIETSLLESHSKMTEYYQKLNKDNEQLKNKMAFQDLAIESPLPRAYQWADGSAYVNHVELVRKARGAEMPENFWHDPLMYQGGSDTFLGPCDPIVIDDEAYDSDVIGNDEITSIYEMGCGNVNESQKTKKLIFTIDDRFSKNFTKSVVKRI